MAVDVDDIDSHVDDKLRDYIYGRIIKDKTGFEKFETDTLQFVQCREVYWEELFRLTEMITPLTMITSNKKDYPLNMIFLNSSADAFHGDTIHITNKNNKILYTTNRGQPEFRLFSRWIFKFFSI
jgi:hypothetical protein